MTRLPPSPPSVFTHIQPASEPDEPSQAIRRSGESSHASQAIENVAGDGIELQDLAPRI